VQKDKDRKDKKAKKKKKKDKKKNKGKVAYKHKPVFDFLAKFRHPSFFKIGFGVAYIILYSTHYQPLHGFFLTCC